MTIFLIYILLGVCVTGFYDRLYVKFVYDDPTEFCVIFAFSICGWPVLFLILLYRLISGR